MSLPGSTRPLPVEEVALHLRNTRAAVGTPGRVRAPSFRRVLEQVVNHHGDGFIHEGMQRLYLVAREADATLSPPVFLLRHAGDPEVRRMAVDLLGFHQFVMDTTRAATDFWDAAGQVVRSMKTSVPPFDAVLDYGSWRYLSDLHIDAGLERLGLTPMNAPIFKKIGGTLTALSPDWDLARRRGNGLVAKVQLLRAGVTVPDGATGPALFQAVSRAGDVLRDLRSYLDPELVQPLYKTAFTLDTGYSPVFSSRWVTLSAPQAPSPRNILEAKWELAARAGDGAFIEMTDDELRAARDRARQHGGTGAPSTRPGDVYAQASRDELYAIALGEPSNRQVQVRTWEWEHHRAQRVPSLLAQLIDTLGDRVTPDPAVRERLKSTMRVLTGLTDPSNLHLVSRWWHAREDALAGLLQRGPAFRSPWTIRDLRDLTFAANPGRVDRLGNLNVIDDITRHADAQRVMNPFVAYDPRQLVALLEFLHGNGVLDAANGLRGPLRDRFNGMVRALNTTIDLYGMSGPRLSEIP